MKNHRAPCCVRGNILSAVRDRRHLGELEGAGVGEWRRTFAIITTDANELVADIHDRMPVILAQADYARWLGEEPDPRDLMRPFPADLMRMWPISTRVNKPENDDPTIVDADRIGNGRGVATFAMTLRVSYLGAYETKCHRPGPVAAPPAALNSRRFN